MFRTAQVRALIGSVCCLALAACSGGSNAATGSDLTGEIVISGSSTVEPISTLVAELFQGANPEVSISVNGPGTGDGFELFCNGETDVSDASRPIDEEEAAACSDGGIEFIELKVGIDGISVITSVDDQAVQCLDFKDLYALLGPESKGFGNWSDANDLAEEIGAGNAPYPDAPLVIAAPGEESGTYDSFTELVLEETAEERGLSEEEWLPRPDYQATPTDNVIIEAVGGTPSSLGWVGYAFYEENQETVKAIAVDDGDGCTEPTQETIGDGSYPIARDLYIYVNAEKADSDTLTAFIDFYLSEEGLSSVSEVGYVSLPQDEIDASRGAWEERTTGSREG